MANVTAPVEGGSSILQCDSVYGPGAGHLHDTGIGGNPYPYGECTWYVWQYYHDTQGVDIARNMGNATDWVTSAQREGWTVDQTPAVGKTVSWSAAKYPIFGHVAVVTDVAADGSFTVTEANFTYYADKDPFLAGKIDCRAVKSTDGISGFLTPHGVQTGSGQSNANILDALGAPMRGIATGIEQAGLYVQAELMTAQHRLTSMAQVGVGLGVLAGGGLLAAFTLAGRGDPSAGARAVTGRMRQRGQEVAEEMEPEPQYPWTDAERRWLPNNGVDVRPRSYRPAAVPSRTSATRSPGSRAPRTPSPAAQLRAEIRAAQAARKAAGPNSRAWVDASVRLNTARNKLAALKT